LAVSVEELMVDGGGMPRFLPREGAKIEKRPCANCFEG